MQEPYRLAAPPPRPAIAFAPGSGTHASARLIAGPVAWSLGTEEPT